MKRESKVSSSISAQKFPKILERIVRMDFGGKRKHSSHVYEVKRHDRIDQLPSATQLSLSYMSITPRNPRRQTVLLTFYVWSVLITFVILAPVGVSIDCFKCASFNGNNPSCEDPFHNNYSASILESPCMGGRKGRNGLFPATACIKLIGTYDDNGHTVVVRGCALDSNTLTTDTEIIRMSHCGGFELDDRYVKGCLQSCDDAEGCNFSNRPISSKSTLLIIALVILFTFYHPNFHNNQIFY